MNFFSIIATGILGYFIYHELKIKRRGWEVLQKVKVCEDGRYLIQTIGFKKGWQVYACESSKVQYKDIDSVKRENYERAKSLVTNPDYPFQQFEGPIDSIAYLVK